MLVVDPFAVFGGLFPGFFGYDIFIPEGKGAALFGTGLIDHAFVAVAQENTIIGGRLFDDRSSKAYALKIFLLELAG